MKNLDTLLLALIIGVSANILSCGEKGSNVEGEGEALADMESSEEQVSPLRTAEGKIGNKEVKVQYGSPSVRERVIWGDLIPYDEVWRTGANEATFVEFSESVTVEGETLNAGKYSLFTIPKKEGTWTVIFNKEWDLEHGHYQYKEENDVLRVEVAPGWEDNIQEGLTINIIDPGLVIKWEKMSLPINIQ